MAEGKKRSHWGQNLQPRSFDSSSGQVNKTQMGNLRDLISEKRGSRSNSGKLAKKETLDDASDDEIIVINKETVFEASIALTAGFPSDLLIKEEKDYGVVSQVDGIEQINYVLIRNHILRKWRDDVSKWISKEMFVGIVPKQCGALLDAAHGFLVSNGFINFGVAPSIKERILIGSDRSNVIVVGAGLAGLAAARQLMASGCAVTVLEGRLRAGGRVCTKKWEAGNNKIAAVDLGGSTLAGISVNPLGILAQQLSITAHKLMDKCPLYGMCGTRLGSCLDSRVDASFNELLDKLNEVRQSMGDVSQYLSLGAGLKTFQEALNEQEMNVLNWHFANLEFANANLLCMLSLAYWDQDDKYEMEGGHSILQGGNGKLVEALIENVPIHYGKIVESICYGGDGVLVTVGGGQVYKGDMVVCTVPLGVLKSRTIRFVPELPQRKLDAIRRLGFGLFNKVALLFPYAFWGKDQDSFGHVCDHPNHYGEFFLFYSYATVAGGPVLIAFVAGEAAYRFENEDPAESVKKVLQILKGIFEPKGINVPFPLQFQCTRWGSDPLSRGSYSSLAVGSSGDDYDIIAESVRGRLFFAGEATNRMYPATMHGAFLSGFREAGKIALSLRSKGKKTETEVTSANKHESVLGDLFRQPDVKLGCYAILYGRKEARTMAILRVTLSKRKKFDELSSTYSLFEQLHSESNQQQESHFYRLISRRMAAELMKVSGGDVGRMKFLLEKLGATLMGRVNRFKVHTMDSVIDSIKAKRTMSSGECSR